MIKELNGCKLHKEPQNPLAHISTAAGFAVTAHRPPFLRMTVHFAKISHKSEPFFVHNIGREAAKDFSLNSE
jgi:hypothetical protein